MLRRLLARLAGRRAPAAPPDPAAIEARLEADRAKRRAQNERLRGIIGGGGAPDVMPDRLSTLEGRPGEVRATSLLQFWHGVPTPDVKRMLAVSAEACAAAGLEHVVLDAATGRAELERIAPEAVAHYDRAFHPAMQADILRLHWLHAHGGWWCDADLAITADVPVVLPARSVFFAYGMVGNSVLFTAPQRPIYRLMLKRMHERLDRFFARYPEGPYFAEDVILLTGPRFMKAPINEHFAAGDDDSVLFVPRSERARFVRVAVEVLGRPIDYKAAGGAWHGKTGPLDALGRGVRDARRAAAAAARAAKDDG